MVKATKFPTLENGQIDTQAWARQLLEAHEDYDLGILSRVADKIDRSNLEFGLELAGALAELKMDQDSVLAGLIYRDIRTEQESVKQLLVLVGADAAGLVQSVLRMASTSLLEMSNSNLHDSEQESQVENIKRMLVAMIDDPRVAVVKLAERVVAIRDAKNYTAERRLRIANEALAIFAPLAGRLGIGQLKWELEDFALRYTEQDTYMRIAGQLRRKRAEREGHVKAIEGRLQLLLQEQGIEASVQGRAKHIYSILRKMRLKGVPFEEVYDVSAFRIVVKSMAECYAALGLIHTTWSYLPSEFDDYIANPKENGYQSIHTAISMEGDEMVEVQIRTEEMHAEAELGVCAHWSYKGDHDHSDEFNLKTDWLRQVIEWHEELHGTERLSTLLRHRANDERIYVSTPHGHVLDLPPRATLLDFAYRVHTDVGHSCVGGLVDGVEKPIYQVLHTSQQVSVATDDKAVPQRAWLEREFGFVNTDRARAKLATYFRARNQQERIKAGTKLLDEAIAILGMERSPDDGQWVADNLDHSNTEQLLDALGGGDLGLFEVVEAFIMRNSSRQQLPLPGLAGEERTEVARLFLRAKNRDGLLHDLTSVVGSMQLPLTATSGQLVADGSEAVLNFETAVHSWRQKLILQSRVRQIRGVYQVGLWSREQPI